MLTKIDSKEQKYLNTMEGGQDMDEKTKTKYEHLMNSKQALEDNTKLRRRRQRKERKQSGRGQRITTQEIGCQKKVKYQCLFQKQK